jgi:tetratricopeptide (TPR) repeat protein
MDGKSVGMSDAEWAKQKTGIEGSLHNTLGSIYFNKQDYDKAVDELTAATKDMPKDGPSWYLLGLAYNQQYISQQKPYQEAVNKSNAAIKAKEDQALIEESKATALALEQVLRDKREQAIDALATAVACGGTTKDPAMDQLKKLYTTKNNGSTDGLDQLINSKKPAQ